LYSPGKGEAPAGREGQAPGPAFTDVATPVGKIRFREFRGRGDPDTEGYRRVLGRSRCPETLGIPGEKIQFRRREDPDTGRYREVPGYREDTGKYRTTAGKIQFREFRESRESRIPRDTGES